MSYREPEHPTAASSTTLALLCDSRPCHLQLQLRKSKLKPCVCASPFRYVSEEHGRRTCIHLFPKQFEGGGRRLARGLGSRDRAFSQHLALKLAVPTACQYVSFVRLRVCVVCVCVPQPLHAGGRRSPHSTTDHEMKLLAKHPPQPASLSRSMVAKPTKPVRVSHSRAGKGRPILAWTENDASSVLT